MISLYLSSNRLLAVCGERKRGTAVIRRCCSSADISQTMFHGSVTDENAFCEIIRQFFRQNNLPKKNVILVLDSPQIILRMLKAPKQSQSRTIGFLANEFADIERYRKPVFAYSRLQHGSAEKVVRLLGIETDGEYLCSMAQLFARSGVSIRSIQPAVSCGIRALAGTEFSDKTYILQVKEGAGFSSFLFVQGVYTYGTYNGVGNAASAAAVGSELARSVSVISQFAQAQHIGESIEDVLLAGFDEESRQRAAESIRLLNADIRTQALGQSRHILFPGQCSDLGECLFAAGGLLPSERSAGLPLHADGTGAQRSRHQRLVKLIGLFTVLVLLLGAATWTLTALRNDRRKRLNELLQINDSAAVQAAQYESLLASLGTLNERNTALDTFFATLESYPLPNAAVRQGLEDCADEQTRVVLIGYDSGSGELLLDAAAQEVESIHRFIDAIAAQGSFRVREYSGYTYDESTQSWRVSVTVALSPGAGRES